MDLPFASEAGHLDPTGSTAALSCAFLAWLERETETTRWEVWDVGRPFRWFHIRGKSLEELGWDDMISISFIHATFFFRTRHGLPVFLRD